jgi:hypothetical protein
MIITLTFDRRQMSRQAVGIVAAALRDGGVLPIKHHRGRATPIA